MAFDNTIGNPLEPVRPQGSPGRPSIVAEADDLFKSLGPVDVSMIGGTAVESAPASEELCEPNHRRHLSVVSNDFDGLFDAVEEEWQDRALCAQTDPEAFFPEKGGSTREAKRICSGCEVKAECLEYALHNDERFGIWGGLSERERRRLKRGII